MDMIKIHKCLNQKTSTAGLKQHITLIFSSSLFSCKIWILKYQKDYFDQARPEENKKLQFCFFLNIQPTTLNLP